MTEVQVAQKDSFVANEPVVVSAVVAWLFTVLGTFICGHTDLITPDTWSGLATFLVPAISAIVLTGLAFLTRKFVMPAWKKVISVTSVVGLPKETLDKLIAEGVIQELKDLAVQMPDKAALIQDILNAVEGKKPTA